MTMTRKDFISIATAIDESTINVDSLDIDDLLLNKKEFIRNMCIILKANNNRFDKDLFRNACKGWDKKNMPKDSI